MLKKILFLIAILYCTTFYSQNENEIVLDSFNKHVALSDSITFPEEKIKFLDKALFFAEKLNIDSLFIKTSSELAYQNVILDDKASFEKANTILLNIYQNKKDSTALGLYYKNKGWYFENNASIDSAFYYYNKSKIVFKKSKNKRLKKIYFDLLYINLSVDDFLGLEELAIEILSYSDFKTDYDVLGEAYACLGIASSNFQDYENALKYHQNALELIRKIRKDETRKREEIRKINDIGLMYLQQDKFDIALTYFIQALKIDPNLKKNDIHVFLALIHNKGICEVGTGRKTQGLKSLNKGLKTAKELNILYLQIAILLDLATFYKKENNLTKAKYYVDKSLVLSRKINYKELEALKLSAEIYTGRKSIEFYKKCIDLKEKIDIKEQKRKNKFARVRFETQKKEVENTRLKKEGLIAKGEIKDEQNKSKIIMLVAIISLLITFSVLLFYKSRQRVLRYKSNLEKAKVREQERQKIAVTLHDKIVGDLRLIYERVLKSNTNNIAEPLYKVNSEIRNLSHKLSSVSFNEVSFKDQIINLVSDYYAPKFKVKIQNLEQVDWSLIAQEIKRTFYFVIRESIQNSKQHASASSVFIVFEKKQKSLYVCIKDNGNGFDIKSLKSGLGLKNLKKRVEELNGTYTIESDLKLGTTTKIEIPLKA